MKPQILLVDVDSKIPNIALGKISTYWKNHNANVKLMKLGFNGYPTKKKPIIVDAKNYDFVYASNIFTVNQDLFKIINCARIYVGGVGSKDYSIKLPEHIEHQEIDYSLYPDNDKSYGFITRGCIRKCSFCFVPKTEGYLKEYNTIDQIIRHKKVSFMDNNILAYEKHKEILQKLIDRDIKCQFNQGLDLRLIDEENAELLSKLKYIGEYIFAFDNVKYKNMLEIKLKIIKKYVTKDWRIKFFIYCNADMNISDTIFRIEWCRKNKCLPYLMRDKNCWESKNKEFYIDLSAYTNQPSLFKNMNFTEYIYKRQNKNIQRAKSSEKLYYSGTQNELRLSSTTSISI